MAESLKKSLDKMEKTMSSDAQVSEISTDNAFQPANLWFGSSRQSTKKHTETDSLFGSTEFVDASSDELAGPPPLNLINNDPPPDGTGTVIAVLDSGINTSHITLKDKISPASKSFVDGSIEDTLGHGTQCAGLACSLQDIVGGANLTDVFSFAGIAPGAQVLVCKVVPDGQKDADINAVCQALDYILAHNTNASLNERVSVASLSFGMSHFNLELSKKIQEVVYNDIIVVCAASNDGRKLKQSINYPARLGHVLCIGSCNNDGKPSSFSPTGREIDFLACGENICAPTIGGSQAYTGVTGTSFSAPLVAGLICQVVQDLKQLSEKHREPYLEHLHNVWGMREILKHMAVVQGKHDEELGYGTLNPMDYFRKTEAEKALIFFKILTGQYN